MKEKDLQETNTPKLDDIEFILEGEKPSVIFLFKSIESAKQAIKKNERYDMTWMSVANIKNSNEENLIKIISALYNTYMVVALINDENNFTEKEIRDISLKSLNEIYSEDADRLGIGGSFEPYFVSEIVNKINKYNIKFLLGKTFYIESYAPDGLYFFYKNVLLKAWEEKKRKSYKRYITVLTNYSFKIISIFNYSDGIKKQDLEFEITDLHGNTSHVLISATDKSSLSNFRKNVNPTGSFIDLMTSEDFNKILNQLYTGNDYKTVCKYDRPGLIADKDVYLTANEVIELEN